MVQDKDWKEKRKYSRTRVQKPVRYRIIHGGDPGKVSRMLRGLMINIGGGGILLCVNELVTDGLHISFNEDIGKQNWLALEMDLFPGRPPIRAMGKVVWYQKSAGYSEYRFDVGIEFKDIREEDRKTIMDFVSRSVI